MKTTETGILLPRQALVLARFKAPEDARETLSPGTYEAVFTADVAGHIKIGEDYEATEPIPWKEICLSLLAVMETKKALKLAERAIGGMIDETLANALDAHLKPMLAKRECKGKITGACVVRIHES